MIANPNDGNSPRVEVATPMIDVSAGGLITATTEQEKGYVPGGTKSATQQLTTQGAKTVTPTTTNQTAVASGRYTTGDVKVAGDANLVPENIAEGVSIFGVQGTHAGGGGSVETVTITYQSSIDTAETKYVNSEQELITSNDFSVEVPKNSIVGISGSGRGNTYISGDYTVVNTDYSSSYAVFVMGDLSVYSGL